MKLRNITFASTSISVLSTGNMSRVLVRWALNPSTQDLTRLKFFIHRGESPTALLPISAGIDHNAVEYVDYSAKLQNLHKVYYYQVWAVEYAGDTPVQAFTSPVRTWEGAPDLVTLYIINEHLFAFEKVCGMPAVIFKKFREGVHCPRCFDTVLKRVTKSDCTTCYGTGFLYGYYPPIPGWADFNPDPKVARIVEWGETKPSQTDIKYTNYPILVPGDIVVELEPNKYWNVVQVQPTQKNRTTILQICRLDAVKQMDIEYTLAIPQALRTSMIDSLNQRRKLIES